MAADVAGAYHGLGREIRRVTRSPAYRGGNVRRLRAGLVKQVAPPIFFIVIASLALLVLAAVIGPLISLIQNLA